LSEFASSQCIREHPDASARPSPTAKLAPIDRILELDELRRELIPEPTTSRPSATP
jgi:hypothetical protein